MPTLTEKLQWPPFLHPLDQAQWWLPGIKLYPWQADTILDASQPKSRVARSTPNEAGKTSFLIPVFGFATMVAFPGAMVYSTSGSELQVREQLFINQLEPIVQRLKAENSGWEIHTAKGNMFVASPERYGLRSRWVGYKCAKGGNVEGFHGKDELCSDGKIRYRPLAYTMDESKTIPDDIFQGVMRINPDFLLAVSTPGAESGWFYRAIDPDTLEPLDEIADTLDDDEIADMDDDEIAERIVALEASMEERERG